MKTMLVEFTTEQGRHYLTERCLSVLYGHEQDTHVLPVVIDAAVSNVLSADNLYYLANDAFAYTPAQLIRQQQGVTKVRVYKNVDGNITITRYGR